jgi:hypothetical protein
MANRGPEPENPRVYCTRFDSGYLARAVVTWESLRAVDPGAQLHVVCFDDRCYEAMSALALEGVTHHPLSELEAWDPELAGTRKGRSWVEYLWTAIPVTPMFALERSGADSVTFLDADLMFFSSPQPIFDELGSEPLLLTPARYPAAYPWLAHCGLYPTQYLPLTRDPTSQEAYAWWRERCIEHCSEQIEVEENRYADQKYLERWLELFEGVHVLEHPGAGLAPWNMERHEITAGPAEAPVLVDGRPLIFFHYTRFRRYRNGRTDPADPRFRVPRNARELIFEPYAERLGAASERIAALGLGIDPYDAEPTLKDRMNLVHSRLAGIANRARARVA